MPKDIKKYIGQFKKELGIALEESAQYALNLSKERIAKGKNFSGLKMKSKKSKRIGDYSASYSKERKRNSKANVPFDLNLKGRLLRNYRVSKVRKRTEANLEVKVFVSGTKVKDRDITYAELAQIHEEGNSTGTYEGQGKIFGITDSEQKKSAKYFYKQLKSNLK